MKRFLMTVLVAVGMQANHVRAEAPDPLVDQMDAAQIQEVIQILRDQYIRNHELDDVTLSRAMLEGLLRRIEHGVMLQAAEGSEKNTGTPSLGEVLPDGTGYFRLGTLDADAVTVLDKLLAAEKPPKALVIDLRYAPISTDFESAGALLSRFLGKGRLLFAVSGTAKEELRRHTSNRDPAWDGVTVVLTDRATSGAAEVIAAVLQSSGALVIGDKTPGAAMRYEPFLLANGMVLRVGVGDVRIETKAGELKALGPIEPNVYFPISPSLKEEALTAATERGVAAVAFDEVRPRYNEAALVAGGNPEMDAMQERQKNGAKAKAVIDLQLQRAIDLANAAAVFQPKP